MSSASAIQSSGQLLLRDGLLESAPPLLWFERLELRLSHELVEITDLANQDRWQELQSATGTRALQVQGEAVVSSEGALALLMARLLAGSANQYRLNFAPGRAFTGQWRLRELSLLGSAEADSQQLSLMLMSSGTMTLVTP